MFWLSYRWSPRRFFFSQLLVYHVFNAFLMRFCSVNGLLTWIGHGFGIDALTLQLVLQYIFYPVAFFLGVPRDEILRVARILATKLIENEFAGYTQLIALQQTDEALSQRGFTIATYALCGFANLSSMGIQIGVLTAMAPSRAKIISRVAFSAMICGFISTLQTASIAWVFIHSLDCFISILILLGASKWNACVGVGEMCSNILLFICS